MPIETFAQGQRPAGVTPAAPVPHTTLVRLYLLNAAYWHEWELFGIPGGIQLFLVLNLLLVLLMLYGYQALLMARRPGVVLSWMLAAGGIFAAAIHALFLLRGSQAFMTTASLSLLAATLVLSVLQAGVLWRYGSSKDGRQGG
jgi:hypothetical protein